MKKKYLETGKIVGTHGVKGMLRVQYWCDDADFLKNFKSVYTDNEGNGRLEVLSVQSHGNIVLMSVKGIDSIEKAEKLRNSVIYINRDDIKLPDGRYFIDDLIGCTVLDSCEKKLLGTLTDVSATGANDVWHITRDSKEYLIPAIDEVIVSVDIETETVVINPLKGIFDDED